MINKNSLINIIIKFYLSFFVISIVFSFDSNLSIESKYGQGIQILGYDSNDPIIDSTYKYNEHIFDVSLIFENGVYFHSQFEYSKPPAFGKDLLGLNNFYLEYEGDALRFKLGDLYALYGRGLSINMFQDQTIDYDNSLRGFDFSYYLNESITLFGLAGVKEFEFRTLPSERISDLGLSNTALFGGIEYDGFHYLYLYEKSVIDYDKYTFSNYSLIDGLATKTGLDTLYTYEHNISASFYLLETDIYIENSQVKYNSANGRDISGSKLYGSVYKDIFSFGVTYEYKNYFMEDYIQTLSNPPIVFRESNSPLSSRNSHVINWGDEIGHQLAINKYFNDILSMEMNFSVAYNHKKGSGISDVLDVVLLSESIYDRTPFRQIYLSINGWLFDNRLYYKAGYDNFNEFKSNPDYVSIQYNHIQAITFPTLFTYTFGENSITTYIEKQIKTNKEFLKTDNSMVSISKEYSDRYFSLTFSYKGKISTSYFFEDEYYYWKNHGNGLIIKDNEYKKWQGIDFSININSTTQFSLFYGSQKGGLVCANGVCADQPGIDDGLKLTIRSLF